MSEQLFDVVFFGILQAGKDKETVMQNMAALFKTEAKKLAPYFAGGRKVIKGNINAGTAEKYRAALENVGLVIKIEACEVKQSEAPTEAAATAESATSSTQVQQTGDARADPGSITMAEVGADVIESPVQVPAQEIADISNVTMAEVGADVIENPVEMPVQEIDDISSITMAEVGSDVLEHPQEVVPQQIEDISAITLAEAGADIIENPKPKETAKIPDTSELSLD